MTIITDPPSNIQTETNHNTAKLDPLMAMEARLNAQGFLIEILFYHMLKDQQAGSSNALAFFNKLRRVPALKQGDPFIACDDALPFVAEMDGQLCLHRDRVASWIKADEDKVPAEPVPISVNQETQKEDLLPQDPSFEDVQNFVADELEDLIDSQGLKDKIKGIFGHDE